MNAKDYHYNGKFLMFVEYGSDRQKTKTISLTGHIEKVTLEFSLNTLQVDMKLALNHFNVNYLGHLRFMNELYQISHNQFIAPVIIDKYRDNLLPDIIKYAATLKKGINTLCLYRMDEMLGIPQYSQLFNAKDRYTECERIANLKDYTLSPNYQFKWVNDKEVHTYFPCEEL